MPFTAAQTQNVSFMGFNRKSDPRTRPRGTATRATYKQRAAEIQAAMSPVTTKVEGPLTRLLGTQTSGFVLKSMDATAGDIAGNAYNIEIETTDGTTLYIKAGDARA